MIGAFPDPYPDEIFYSVCARLCERAGYSKYRIAIQDLFGCETVIASVTLPSHLDDFVARLPPGSAYTSDYFIEKHTLLPFYRPFLPPERLSRLQQAMRGRKGPAIHMLSGIMASHVPLPEWLHFCPQCVIEDRNRYGECYWHRIHQVSGVEVCPFHEAYLHDSIVRARNKRTRQEFVSAEYTLHDTIQLRPNVQGPYHLILLEIARDVHWLLCQHHLSQDLKLLHHGYRRLLAELDLATYRGRVDVGIFLQMFKNRYSTQMLHLLHCELEEDIQESWLLRLVRTPHSAQHPLYHILLMHFLGQSADSFFVSLVNLQPFGVGPWPCLNSVCTHYHLFSIGECQLVHSPHVHGKPIGTFECACGFAYSRTGPDMAREYLFRRGKVKSFGTLWEIRLRTLWEDETVSLRAIARHLGVDPLTVKRHADRIGLTFPRLKRISLPLKETQKLSSSLVQVLKIVVLDGRRIEWLNIMQEHPEAGVKMLRSKEPSLYIWLYKNDRTWLQTHIPSYKKPQQLSLRIDWKERDMRLAEYVTVTVSCLKKLPGKPVHVTVSAIGREVGQLALLQQHLDKLPRTAEIIEQLVETREAFAVRRIEWAMTVFKQEHINPERWLLVKRAGVERLINHPQVRNAMDIALQKLWLNMD